MLYGCKHKLRNTHKAMGTEHHINKITELISMIKFASGFGKKELKCVMWHPDEDSKINQRQSYAKTWLCFGHAKSPHSTQRCNKSKGYLNSSKTNIALHPR